MAVGFYEVAIGFYEVVIGFYNLAVGLSNVSVGFCEVATVLYQMDVGILRKIRHSQNHDNYTLNIQYLNKLVNSKNSIPRWLSTQDPYH